MTAHIEPETGSWPGAKPNVAPTADAARAVSLTGYRLSDVVQMGPELPARHSTTYAHRALSWALEHVRLHLADAAVVVITRDELPVALAFEHKPAKCRNCDGQPIGDEHPDTHEPIICPRCKGSGREP